MKTLVISLDSETGRARRDNLNFPYDWQRATTFAGAPAFLKDRCRMMHNINPRTREATIGCFASHYKIWEQIVEHGWKDVVVCEDDARLHTEIPDPKKLPDDGACLLGGEICEPSNWKLHEAWKRTTREGVVNGFNAGCNHIDYTLFRWRCTVAIYYPNPKVAEALLEKVRTSPRMTHIDLTLAKLWAVKYLYYPSVFDCNDGGVSQISMATSGQSVSVLRDYQEKKVA